MLKRFLMVFAVASVAVVGCKKENEVAPVTTPTGAVAADKVRLIVTVPTSTKDTDKLTLAGSFPNESWDPKKSAKYELKRNTATEYTIDLAISDLPKSGDLEYKVVKNVTATDNSDGWKFVEKTIDCKELATNRTVTTPATQGGKSIKITVDAFRNTGTCGD
ncbi:MAG: hypothetical protein EAZ91_03675 [Cytophagales bacterium]|nr:MAG: hypothetical protein EAZ91_03675 [Cytophagales bacterium]